MLLRVLTLVLEVVVAVLRMEERSEADAEADVRDVREDGGRGRGREGGGGGGGRRALTVVVEEDAADEDRTEDRWCRDGLVSGASGFGMDCGMSQRKWVGTDGPTLEVANISSKDSVILAESMSVTLLPSWSCGKKFSSLWVSIFIPSEESEIE